MKSRLRTSILTTLLLVIGAKPSFGQAPADTVTSVPGIEIRTSVDVAEVYIGDLIRYSVAITYDSTYQLEPPPLGANLGAFDVKDYEPDVSTVLPDGRKRSETVFILTTFTTGDYVIPPVPVLFTFPDSSRKVLLAEPVPIKVKSLLAEADDSLDIYPLKAQFAFPHEINPLYYWGGGAILLLIIALVLWLLLRKKKAEEEPVDLRPPWEIAFEKLALLQQQNLPASESFKQYYFELTDIARAYLGRIYELDLPEMTTDETLAHLSEVELPDGLFDQFAEFLHHADLVKFARYVPELPRTDSDFQFVHEMIETVRADYERRQQLEAAISGPDDQTPVMQGEVS